MARCCAVLRCVGESDGDYSQCDGPQEVPGGPQRADEQEQAEGDGNGMGMGTGPSVLLAISQRNMWMRGDHACTSSGPLADPWIGKVITFPRAAGMRRFVRGCSRNNDWRLTGSAQEELTGGMQRREIEARAGHFINLLQKQAGPLFDGGVRASGRGEGRPYGGGHEGTS